MILFFAGIGLCVFALVGIRLTSNVPSDYLETAPAGWGIVWALGIIAAIIGAILWL